MKFCWTTLNVKNMDDSLDFYQQIAGLPLQRRAFAGPGIELAFLGEGETQIELIFREGKTDASIGEDISLGFEVSNLDDMLEYIHAKQIPVHLGPFQVNEHIRFFYVLDPNGLRIQFVEHS